jgi:hypothetical protein
MSNPLFRSWRFAAVVVALAAPASAAPPVFEPAVPVADVLSGENPGSSEGRYPAIATDGAGTWIVATPSDDTLDRTIDIGRHILLARSTDGGLSFSNYAALTYASASARVSLATNGSGVWMAVSDGITLARSTDNGVTWRLYGFYLDSIAPSIATDGAGTWLVIWQYTGPGGDGNVFASRSTDDGYSWSSATIVSAESPSDPKQDVLPRLYFSGGVWLAVWTAMPFDFGAQDRDVLFARSVDGGRTWSAPAPLSTTAYADHGADHDPQLASDGAGNWVAVWASENPLGVFALGTDGDIQFARSSDGGATWTPPAPLNTDAATDGSILDEAPSIATNATGTFVAAWRRRSPVAGPFGTDDDLFTATSEDGGATWSAAAPLLPSMATDTGSDIDVQMSYDARRGRWLATWTTDQNLTAWPPRTDTRVVTSFSDEPCGNGVLDAGEACDDGVRAGSDCCDRTCRLSPVTARCEPDTDVCTNDRCDGAGTCIHAYEPRAACRVPVTASASTLRLRGNGDPVKSELVWKWTKGPGARFDEIGRPDETGYALCLYDGSGLVSHLEVPGEPAPHVGEPAHWRSTFRRGDFTWQYKNSARTPNGVEKLSLLGPVNLMNGQSIILKAKGVHLAVPPLPITASTITAQLVFDELTLRHAQCWGASYSTAAAIRNDDGKFSARSE